MKTTKKIELPDCRYSHPDCFALIMGKCWCLENTEFKNGRDCPFYKPENEVDFNIIIKKYKELKTR